MLPVLPFGVNAYYFFALRHSVRACEYWQVNLQNYLAHVREILPTACKETKIITFHPLVIYKINLKSSCSYRNMFSSNLL